MLHFSWIRRETVVKKWRTAGHMSLCYLTAILLVIISAFMCVLIISRRRGPISVGQMPSSVIPMQICPRLRPGVAWTRLHVSVWCEHRSRLYHRLNIITNPRLVHPVITHECPYISLIGRRFDRGVATWAPCALEIWNISRFQMPIINT